MTASVCSKVAPAGSMARSGLDYSFFQLLTDRMQHASGEQQAQLMALRDKLLEMTHEIDQAIKEQEDLAGQLLDKILAEENIEEATLQALPGINEIFLEVLRAHIQTARKADDQEQLKKLQQVAGAIQKVSSPGANIELIEELIQAKDIDAIRAILEENDEEITDEFSQFLYSLLSQTQAQEGRQEMVEKLQQVYRQVLRFTMKRNLEKAD